MNPLSIDVKDMLEAESELGLTFRVNLFIAKEPESPDACVTIFDTGGPRPQVTFEQGENYYYESVQIRIRDNSFQDAMSLARSIMEELHVKNNETWNGAKYTLLQAITAPALLDWDDNERARIVINFDAQRR